MLNFWRKLFLPKGWYLTTASDGTQLKLYWTGSYWETRLCEYIGYVGKIRRII